MRHDVGAWDPGDRLAALTVALAVTVSVFDGVMINKAAGAAIAKEAFGAVSKLPEAPRTCDISDWRQMSYHM